MNTPGGKPQEVLPLVEGGKGISISTGESSGAWAAAGGVGTFSGVNADYPGPDGRPVEQIYHGKTRRERHDELIAYGIKGAIHQAQVAHETRNGEGRLHMNVLWEMGGAEKILHGALEGAKGLIQGVTCGAGMPYKLAEICSSFNVNYLPIVSSSRAFRALWLRSYSKFRDWLGAVVYEDPWLAGGHNGLSNSENPEQPESPLPRVIALREFMNSVGLENVPIIMAGGVWHISEWAEWLENKLVGPIGFQFGTRPLLTRESPISDAWKQKLLQLKEGDVFLNKFSPTGFYSSAVNNPFIKGLRARSERQIPYSLEPVGELDTPMEIGAKGNRAGRTIYVATEDKHRAEAWLAQGFTEALRTPDQTFVFETPEKAAEVRADQIACMGCLSACQFSNWSQHDDVKNTTGRTPDPRSFCIQKTLQKISHSNEVDNQLMFSGHNAYRFGSDPWYANGFVPTVRQLVERIASGY
ncbi:MAG: NAD(P)H-dependent flavin oxidoreductase [Bdellovibrionales bacterium]